MKIYVALVCLVLAHAAQATLQDNKRALDDLLVSLKTYLAQGASQAPRNVLRPHAAVEELMHERELAMSDVTDDELAEFLIEDPTEEELAEADAIHSSIQEEATNTEEDDETAMVRTEINKPPPEEPTANELFGTDPTIVNNLRSLDEVHREKRFVGSIFQMAISGLTLAANVKVLVDTLSEGCTQEPTICTDRDEIETLMEQVNRESDVMAAGNRANELDYLDLREAMVSNQYLMYFTNKIHNEARDYQGFLEDVDNTLTRALGEYRDRYASLANSTGIEMLEQIFGPMEMTLSAINSAISNEQKSGQRTVMINLGVRVGFYSLRKFTSNVIVSSVKKACQTLKSIPNSEITVRQDLRSLSEMWDTLENVDVPPKTKIQKLKIGLGDMAALVKDGVVKESFKEMAKKPGNFFKLVGGKIMAPRDTLTAMKTKLISRINKAGVSLTKRIGYVRNAEFGKAFMGAKNYAKFQEMKTFAKFKSMGKLCVGILGGLASVAGDIVQIVMSNKNWKQIADNTRQAKLDYQARLEEARKINADVAEQKTKLNGFWDDTIDGFVNITGTFKDTLYTVSDLETHIKNADIAIMENIDYDNPIMNPDYLTSITKSNLKEKQGATRNFMQPIEDGYFTVREVVRAFEMASEKVLELTTEGRTVITIQEHIDTSMKAFEVAEVKGYDITLMDTVCFVAYFSGATDKERYDGYDLAIFRTNDCKLTDEQWSEIRSAALSKRFTSQVRTLLQAPIQQQQPITNLLDTVINFFNAQSDYDLKTLAYELTEKQVLCVVAASTTANLYDLHELALFRTKTCDDITDAEYQQVAANAQALKQKSSLVINALTMCLDYNAFCMCFEDLGVTVDEFKALRPPRYAGRDYCIVVPCATTGCITL